MPFAKKKKKPRTGSTTEDLGIQTCPPPPFSLVWRRLTFFIGDGLDRVSQLYPCQFIVPNSYFSEHVLPAFSYQLFRHLLTLLRT